MANNLDIVNSVNGNMEQLSFDIREKGEFLGTFSAKEFANIALTQVKDFKKHGVWGTENKEQVLTDYNTILEKVSEKDSVDAVRAALHFYDTYCPLVTVKVNVD